MITDPKRVSDGFSNLSAGIDQGRDPRTILPIQVADAVNTTFRGGFAHPRPGFWKVPLTFPDSTGFEDPFFRNMFERTMFQGAFTYLPITGKPYPVVACGGRLFKINVNNRSYPVQDITVSSPVDDPNSSRVRKIWFVQAEDFLIVQDGLSSPIIFDGSSSRRADPLGQEVPTGSVMAYGMGRLWVADPDGRFFTAGDIVYGSSGTSAYDGRDAVLKFTENTFLNEGGAFGVPITSGPITAMIFPANLDTSTGQGPLQVFTQSIGFSVNVPTDRTVWKDLTYPISTVNLTSFGPTSQSSTIPINGDIYFRAKDGWRSYVISQRNFATQWYNTPLSNEIQFTLSFDSLGLLEFSSSILFDNRMLGTVSPQHTPRNGTYHKGLCSMDFDILSGIRDKTPPVWEGVWSGLNVLQVLVCGDRCFIFALSSENLIQMWELVTNAYFDRPDGITDTPIAWSITSRTMVCPDDPAGLKELATADLWVDSIIGNVSFTAYFRTDRNPVWKLWNTWSVCGLDRKCNDFSCTLPAPLAKQYRARMRLPNPTSDCDSQGIKPDTQGYDFQVRLDIVGQCQINLFKIHCYQKEEDVNGECLGAEECSGINVCEFNPFSLIN